MKTVVSKGVGGGKSESYQKLIHVDKHTSHNIQPSEHISLLNFNWQCHLQMYKMCLHIQ